MCEYASLKKSVSLWVCICHSPPSECHSQWRTCWPVGESRLSATCSWGRWVAGCLCWVEFDQIPPALRGYCPPSKAPPFWLQMMKRLHSRHWSILATYFYTNILEIDTCSLEQFKFDHLLYWLYQTITFSLLGFTGHFIVGRFLLHTIRNRKYSFKTSKINSKDCLFANPPKRNLLPFDQTVWDVWLLACKAVRQAGKQVYSSSKRTPELQNQHLVFFLFVCISKRDWVCT